MKVALVIPTLQVGGAERVISVLANNWVEKENVEVEIILFTSGKPFYQIDDRVKITNFGFKTHANFFDKIVSLYRLFWHFRNYVKDAQPDFVLSFMTKNNIFALLSLYGLNIKTILSERDAPSEVVPKIRSFLRDRTFKWADGIICQTEVSKKFIVDRTGNTKVVVIPNPMKVVQRNNPYEREKIILNVGRLVDKKGQKYLIEAFSKLKHQDWKLIFLGDGPLRNDLSDYVKKLRLSDSVIFKGTTKDVASWNQKSAIFAFPSILEGYPNALAEAMCNGMACVSFDCQTGPSEIINDGVNGFLIEEKNVGMLVQKLQILIDDEALRVNFSEEAFKLNKILDEKLITDRYYDFCVTC